MVEGKRCDLTSSLEMLRPDDIWQPRMGAPPGNRNRLRHGNETRAMKELRHLIAQWRRQTAALLARAAGELAGSSPVYGGGGPPREPRESVFASTAVEGAETASPPPSRAGGARHLPRCAGEELFTISLLGTLV